MQRANFIGTISLDFLDRTASNWNSFTTDDILTEGIIREPNHHLFTLGSGVQSSAISLATTPAFPLPTNSQVYHAGRDVLRWGGTKDPNEIDIDHYGFTPDYKRMVAIVWKSPKSEPHHLSQRPDLLNNLPLHLRELSEEVLNKRLP